jgi:hypothetical protein
MIVAGILIALGLWKVFDGGDAADTAPLAGTPASKETPTEADRSRAVEPKAAQEPPSLPAVLPAGSVEAVQKASSAGIAAADSPPPASSAASSETTPSTRSVVVKLSPPEATLYYRGKAVGTSGVVVELESGKRRAYEVAARGYVTRRLVLDGSTTEVSLVLRPDAAAPPSVRP